MISYKPEETSAIFTYGTLMCREVMMNVCAKPFEGVSAELPGYERRVVKGQIYPGVIRCANSTVSGVLYDSVDPYSLSRLDLFEDNFYQRIELTVRISSNGTLIPAHVYVVPEENRQVLGESWDIEGFWSRDLANYLKRWEKA